MRSILSFLLLAAVKIVGHLFYRHRAVWLCGLSRRERFRHVRLIVVLNHTSLYEPLLAGFASFGLLWQIARHGVLPVAEKTMKRRIGLFFRFLVRTPVVVTRQRDHTWEQLLSAVSSRALVVILPEGRMMRRNGLDAHGRPMTVRGGVADILEAIPEGRMLVVYSGGLHHIQAPGELVPRLFKRITARIDVIDIPTYRDRLVAECHGETFKAAVIRDLTARRDANCPRPAPPAAGDDGD